MHRMNETPSDWDLVAGLEVHVQLKTESKIFCSCSTAFGGDPNSQVCPVCTGQPGALPVLNRKALELAVRAGLAMNCRIANRTRFARKNYFYPDLPKGYQISQFDEPICGPGNLSITLPDGRQRSIGITRAHLEEDAGKLLHEGDAPLTRIDLNRAGVPLLEIVSQPDFRSAEEIHAWLTHLKQFLQYADVSDCDMEKGSLRCDVNISVRRTGDVRLGTRVEIKNLNSFRFVVQAVEHEFSRQRELLNHGESVVAETRLWDEHRDQTVVMRSKEEATDYRYFPEPDLTPLDISSEWIDAIRATLPELPDVRCNRYIQMYHISPADAARLTQRRELADWFETALPYAPADAIASWLLSDVSREANERDTEPWGLPLSGEALGDLIRLVNEGTVSRTKAKDVLTIMLDTGASPSSILEEKGWVHQSDPEALMPIIKSVLADHPGPVSDFRSGKENALQFLVGQVMQRSEGQADPSAVIPLLKERLTQSE
jgi:aspartyl-tRNA(Asn)/glutamyl-tRNA(Gln) amidotransferase subunit B